MGEGRRGDTDSFSKAIEFCRLCVIEAHHDGISSLHIETQDAMLTRRNAEP